MAVTLAANRLGLSAPSSLFDSPDLQDGLEKLAHDYLFLVSVHQPDGELPVRRIKVHRVLAQELYKSHFPADKPHLRASHLVAYWLAADAQGKGGLIALVGNAVKKNQFTIEEDVAHAFLQQFAAQLKTATPTPQTFEDLAAWAFCAKARGFSKARQQEALAWLLQHLRDRLSAGTGVMDVVHEGLLYYQYWDLVADGSRAAMLLAVRQWLPQHPTQPRWNELWQKLWPTLDAAGQVPMLELAHRWLSANPDHVGWTFLFMSGKSCWM